MNALKNEELEAAIGKLRDWRLEDGKLVRDWSFKDFQGAMGFVNRIAEIAEAEGHHPDIDIRYNRVRLGLVTHDAGGITSRDIAMAQKLSGVPG